MIALGAQNALISRSERNMIINALGLGALYFTYSNFRIISARIISAFGLFPDILAHQFHPSIFEKFLRNF